MPKTSNEHETTLDKIIQPLKAAKWQADFRFDMLERGIASLLGEEGVVDLDPDFQRGHVWTPEQQQHFIENCLRGIVSSSGLLIQFNCPTWNSSDVETDLPKGLQCVDGLQRLTAISLFARGELKPFGLSKDDLKDTHYAPNNFYAKVAVHDFTKRVDLLKHYLSINAGGTPHSPEEIARVKGLLEQALKAKSKAPKPDNAPSP